MNPELIAALPAVNATLNAISTIFLLVGFYFIRQRRIEDHRKMMLGAFWSSVLFLAFYLLYHANVGVGTKFAGQGIVRLIYFFVLITHIVLAAFVPVLAIITLRRGLAKRYDPHRKIAKWTWPIWLYVSVTGVVVYLMLYQWFPGGTVALVP